MSLIEQWNEHIVQGNRLSRELEDFEGIMHVADMQESKVALAGPSGTGTTFVDLVLSPEKMEEIKRLVVVSLNEARMTKEIELEKLMGVRKPATINQEFETAVQDMVKTDPPKKKPTGRKAVELDLEKVKDLYITKGLPCRKIADQCGCAENTIRNYIKKHNLTRDNAAQPVEPAEKPAYPVMTVEAVRKIYTNGSLSLADAAKHFGVASGEIYTYIEKHGLKRQVVKPNDPFLDANKMSKDEFKRKMLSKRK